MPKIEFHISDDLKDVVPHPISAVKSVPDWYRKMPHYNRPIEGPEIETLKKCVPFRDMLTSGYIIPNWCGIRLEKVDGEIKSHPLNDELKSLNCGVSFHSIEQIVNTPLEKLADKGKMLKINSPWVIKTPKGYSTLFLSPQYRDNEIEILPAIVDTDVFYTPVNFPAVMIKNKCWLEQGVPLVQVIPFKRESWTSSVHSWSYEKARKQTIQLMSRISSYYSDEHWIRKIFR